MERVQLGGNVRCGGWGGGGAAAELTRASVSVYLLHPHVRARAGRC